MIEIHSRSDLTPDRREELEDWFSQEFGRVAYRWAIPDWYVMALTDTVLVGRLGIVERIVSVGGNSVLVGGIDGLITHPEWRGRGIATAVLDRALQLVEKDLHAEFSLLLCRPDVAPVYARNGWKPVAGPTVFEQPVGKLTYPRLTMVFEFGKERWPAGPIDLCGLP